MKMLSAVALIALALAGASSSSSALSPVQPSVPVNPELTLGQWEEILDAQLPRPEVCDGCTAGTTPQPEEAGKLAEGRSLLVNNNNRDTKIIGGLLASEGQFPWQAQVRMDNSYFCGGSVISEEWILSAGHCADGFRVFQIVLGSLFSGNVNEPNRLTYTTRSAKTHPNFNMAYISDDISVIRLPSRIKAWTTYVRPIQLPPRFLVGAELTGQPGVISGFGRYGTTSVSPSISPALRYVVTNIISNYECARTFGSYVLSSNICTAGGTSSPTGSCNGDSGGPLSLAIGGSYVEVGIVSFGSGQGCNLRYPSAFTRVTSYLDWISNNTGIAIQK